MTSLEEVSSATMALSYQRTTSRSAIAVVTLAFLLTTNVHVGAYTASSPQKPGAPPAITEREVAFADATTKASSRRRRDLLLETQGIVLATLLVGSDSGPSYAQDSIAPQPLTAKMTIIVTGANSGIGLEACKRLATQGHTLVLACRTANKARLAVERIQETTSGIGALIAAECDLADINSIQSFAGNLPGLVGNVPIDTLCLNAGVARNTGARDCARTKDGFELTVGVNHFGHFYLNHLLTPQLARNGKIVVTASSVHDPDSPGGAQGRKATLGDLQGLRTKGKDCEMIDGTPFDADKAYKDSKLCNVLFTRELQRRLESNDATKGISANCFSPGLTVGTGLFRDQNPVFTKLFDIAATKLLKVGENPEWGGASLAYMTTVSTQGLFYSSPPGSSKYGDAAFGNEFVPTDVSKEGQNDSKARQLWELSEKVLGLSA